MKWNLLYYQTANFYLALITYTTYITNVKTMYFNFIFRILHVKICKIIEFIIINNLCFVYNQDKVLSSSDGITPALWWVCSFMSLLPNECALWWAWSLTIVILSIILNRQTDWQRQACLELLSELNINEMYINR